MLSVSKALSRRDLLYERIWGWDWSWCHGYVRQELKLHWSCYRVSIWNVPVCPKSKACVGGQALMSKINQTLILSLDWIYLGVNLISTVPLFSSQPTPLVSIYRRYLVSPWFSKLVNDEIYNQSFLRGLFFFLFRENRRAWKVSSPKSLWLFHLPIPFV